MITQDPLISNTCVYYNKEKGDRFACKEDCILFHSRQYPKNAKIFRKFGLETSNAFNIFSLWLVMAMNVFDIYFIQGLKLLWELF